MRWGVLLEWQQDDASMQLHPGDLGWFWQFGAEKTAAAVRTWSRGGQIVAVGLLDSPELLRLTIAPEAQRDEVLAKQIVAEVGEQGRGVLPAGKVSVETPNGTLVQVLLAEVGWNATVPGCVSRHLLRPDHLDTRTRLIHGLREIAAQRHPLLADELCQWHGHGRSIR